jgi:hypothetical protein
MKIDNLTSSYYFGEYHLVFVDWILL